jgi:hypothetical protein
VRDGTDNVDPWFIDLPPTSRQKWAAVAFLAILLVCFGVLAPFVDTQLPQVYSFIPAFEAAVFVLDFMTAALLFAHFSVYPSRALQVLASGYLFTALIVIPHALSFPGAFWPTGLLGAGIQTTGTLYFFWHYGFALALLAYACLKKNETRPDARAPKFAAIVPSVAVVVSLVCVLVWLATAGDPLMPTIFSDQIRVTLLSKYLFLPNLLICALAFGVLATRRLSILNLWIMVVILALMLELVQVGLLTSARFTVGFYAGRGFSLITSAIVLTVLIAETSLLFARVAWSNVMLRRAHDNKLMSLEAVAAAISHEVRQPLGAITLSGEAA